MSNFNRKMNKNETRSIKKEMEKVEKDFYKDQKEIYLKNPLNMNDSKLNKK